MKITTHIYFNFSLLIYTGIRIVSATEPEKFILVRCT